MASSEIDLPEIVSSRMAAGDNRRREGKNYFVRGVSSRNPLYK